jgi:hypothetical protein
MKAAVRLAAGLSLWLALSGCLASTGHADHAAGVSEALRLAEAGSDVGNDRPQVSYDGLMVRRREVLVLRIDASGAQRWMSRQLAIVARRGQLTVSPMSASVLDAADLERLAPTLVLSLPRGATRADGKHLMRLALRAAERRGVDVRDHRVKSVLVHDLRFRIRSPHPAALSRAIAREGILADALGSYTPRPGARRLDILYTGPLLSDPLLQSVIRGMARPAHVRTRAVTVVPRSTTGSGVDLADEPTPPLAEFSVAPDEHHH